MYQPFELEILPKDSLLRPITMPKLLLNNFNTTFKKSQKRNFGPPKLSKCPYRSWPEILISAVIYQPFELIIIPNVGLLRPIIMPKHLLTISNITFEKSRKLFFLPYQMAKIWPQILISEGIYQPFVLKIQPKVCLSRPITILKQVLNNSNTTFEKSENCFCYPKNWSKYEHQHWQKFRFFEIFLTFL